MSHGEATAGPAAAAADARGDISLDWLIRLRWGAVCGQLATIAAAQALNPFSVLYLVHIAPAASVLRARWTWFLAGLSLACYGLLFLGHAGSGHAGHSGDELGLHLPAGLQLRVEDEGCGMAPTKPPGQGLGLGVFIARTLSEQMGGRLRLDSRPGRGTTATVEIASALVAGARADAV